MGQVTEEGERHAAEVLRSLYPVLLALAGSLVGVDERDDLVQETLVSVLKRYPRFRGLRKPHAYAKVVLIRRSCRRYRLGAIDFEAVATIDAAIQRDFSETVVGHAVVMDALANLPPRQRACLYLRYVVDVDDRAIAAVLGCSQATVRSQVMRGLTTLRLTEVHQGGFDAQGI
jgi:RNA polymerase sigma factor (sigma-70 family)